MNANLFENSEQFWHYESRFVMSKSNGAEIAFKNVAGARLVMLTGKYDFIEFCECDPSACFSLVFVQRLLESFRCLFDIALG